MHGTPRFDTRKDTAFSYVNPRLPQGGTLRLGVVGSFDSLNPFIVRGTAPSAPGFDLTGAVYQSLMTRGWDEPFSLYCLLADKVELPPDRAFVTFRVDAAARWQDGEAVTADDLIFSLETLRRQGRPNHRTYYKKVARAEKLDARTVRFVFTREEGGAPDREMPLIIGLMPILPAHIWQGRAFNETTLVPPVGSGPYKVAKMEVGRSLTLEKVPDYWARDKFSQRGFYNFQTVRFDYYRDDNVALQAFKAGAFDVRREGNPNKWAENYDGPALQEGRLVQTRFAHGRTESLSGFVLNTRRAPLSDPALREAVGYAFDFGWINKTLFHGAYHRSASLFPNSELAFTDKAPEGAERRALEEVHAPEAAFQSPLLPPETDGADEAIRRNLLTAAAKLKAAGYLLKNDVLFTPGGAPVSFEILLSDTNDEKIALAWARQLARLGIRAHVRTADSAQFQARLTSFDYDVITARWFNTLSPGNEQIAFWSAAAADQPGSRNYPGLKAPALEAMARTLPRAASREDLVTRARALDRLFWAEHPLVPFFYLGADLIAFWPEHVQHPAQTPLYGPILETWGQTAP